MKKIIKEIVSFICILAVSPLSLPFLLTRHTPAFLFGGQVLALMPGKLGSFLRVAFYRSTQPACSKEGYIGFGSFIVHPETELGSNYYIGAYCIIGLAKIGDHATIASHVSILSGKNQHGYAEIGTPIQLQQGTLTKVTVKENCWIGNGAVVMADLGTQNVVAAGSVVVRATGDYEVVGGNPAKTLKRLNGEALS